MSVVFSLKCKVNCSKGGLWRLGLKIWGAILGEENRRFSFCEFICKFSGEKNSDPGKIISEQLLHFKYNSSLGTTCVLVMGALCEDASESNGGVLGKSNWELSQAAVCLVNRMSFCVHGIRGIPSESLSESSLLPPMLSSSQFSRSLSLTGAFAENVDLILVGRFKTEERISFIAVALSVDP